MSPRAGALVGTLIGGVVGSAVGFIGLGALEDRRNSRYSQVSPLRRKEAETVGGTGGLLLGMLVGATIGAGSCP
jgi:hypothetical protein